MDGHRRFLTMLRREARETMQMRELKIDPNVGDAIRRRGTPQAQLSMGVYAGP
jgi:ribosomal protein L31E